MGNRKQISILGSTGSIGVQTLDVINASKDNIEILYLTANYNIDLLEKQVFEFNPQNVVIVDEKSYKEFKKHTSFKGNILCGKDEVINAASDRNNDLVISSLVGFAGVLPTLSAINNGIDVALANKETLVSAGEIITSTSKKNNTSILAIDSEHSAILQCIIGEQKNQIEKIILTASGGPFRNTDISEFKNLTVKQALNHPNWSMGNKITIDSATMMNKGFEVIEAYWLFGLKLDEIDIIIHPQSIIHSMVQFIDGSVKAQLGLPDMRIPISYALNYPNRLQYSFPRLDLTKISQLDFHAPDYEKYPCLKLAYEVLDKGGNSPSIMNAANEVAVSAFLNEKIKFTEIYSIIYKTLEKSSYIENPDISQLVESDFSAREIANNFIN